MKKIFIITLGVILLVFVLGPKVETPVLEKPLPDVPQNLIELNNFVQSREAKTQNIKPENQSRIEFYDSIPQKTEYSVLFLHGFSASPKAGDPIQGDIAKHFKANLYSPRLFRHGLKEEKEDMSDFTADLYLDSVREALAVAKKLGEKIIILGISTGGVFALLFGDDPQVVAIGLYGPNVKLRNPYAKFSTLPWGAQISRIAIGSNYIIKKDATPEVAKFWTTRYHIQAGIHVQKIIDLGMNSSTFSKIKVPVFLGYYYKDEKHQDDVVSVKAAIKMFDQLGTPKHLKKKVAFPEAGTHVITSHIRSDDTAAVSRESILFFDTHLNK